MGCGIPRFGRKGLKTTKTKILVSNFVPRGFEVRRTWGFEARRHGVSRGGAGVSRHGAKGFRGTAPWGFEGRRHCSHCSHCTHLAPSLEVPGNQTGPRGTAPNDKSLTCFIIGAAPRNPMAPRLETPGAPRLKTPVDKF